MSPAVDLCPNCGKLTVAGGRCPHCGKNSKPKGRKHIQSTWTTNHLGKFPSKTEADRALELDLLQKADGIRNLEFHPVFPLVVNGVEIGKYTADSRYIERTPTGGTLVVEEVKKVKTDLYRFRIKVFLALYKDAGFTFREHGYDKRKRKKRGPLRCALRIP